MTRRDHIIQIIGTLIGAILAGFLAGKIPGGIPGLPAPPQPGQVQPGEVQPVPPPPVVPKADPMGARVKLRTTKGGCTGVVINEQRPDGRYLVATASHCVGRVGESASGVLPSGEQIQLVVQSIDRRSDCAWMLTAPTPHALPFARLAAAPPTPGRRVWVAGYGVQAPGVQRWGTFIGGPSPDGQLNYRIAVSPGDSGGPIVDDETGEVYGVVCCTASFGVDASVFAAGPAALRAAMPKGVLDEADSVPVPLPHRRE